VLGSAYLYQTAPQALVFRFDKNVAGSISVDDLELINTTTGQVVPASSMSLSYNSGLKLAIWTINQRLTDGNYVARLKASGLALPSGAALDGNGDGVGGDDYSLNFFQFTGDINRDRIVNNADFRILSKNFGKLGATWDDGDVNYDGKVNFTDFQLLESAFGHTLHAPDPVPALAAVFGSVNVVKQRDFRQTGGVLS
jgi:hypothetical protein